MPQTTQRDLVKSVFLRGLEAADPYHRVLAARSDVSDTPAQIIAFGKAAFRMTQAALEMFPNVPALVVTNYENARELEGATVMAAGHPVPDENGMKAGQAIFEAAEAASGPILVLISGGGSALIPAPRHGVTLDDKAQLNSLLLASGMPINQMNLIRQKVSRLKGGGLLRLVGRNAVTALILSDVIGDDLSAVASGPTSEPMGTKAEAWSILRTYGLWDKLPKSIADTLRGPEDKAFSINAKNLLIGSNTVSVNTMGEADEVTTVLKTPIVGDVAEAAKQICDAANHGVTVWGGETTVDVTGSGKGGRNQELALRIALEAEKRGWKEWTCLQAGSDGRDGPTDAAGGLVDQGTLSRLRDAGGDIDALLGNSDSYAALQLAGDLFQIDATGTNVADLGVLVR